MTDPATMEQQWIITVRIDESRTRDYRVRARSAYHARWLFGQLNPSHRVIAIRQGAPGALHAQ